MTTAARLGLFTLALLVAVAGGWVVGEAIGPDPGTAPAPTHDDGSHP